MSELMKHAAGKAGLAPGTPVHVGEGARGPVRLTVFDYDAGSCTEREVATIADCLPLRESPTVTWINVAGVHDVGVLKEIGDAFGLHPLLVEDVAHTTQRPKADEYEGCLYLAVRMLSLGDGDTVDIEQVSLVLGEHFVISFQEHEGDVFGSVRARIRDGKGRIRSMGTDYLLYSLLDALVDSYYGICEDFGEGIEEIQGQLIESPEPGVLQRVHKLKTAALFLRRSVWPLREVMNVLARGDSGLIGKDTVVYLRDAYDHTVQVVDTIETFRDMVGGMMELYLSSVSNRMNEVMKVLTIIATIFIPLSFVAGVYGMNFANMPELGWRFGYPVVLAVMTVAAGAMLLYFRRKGWL